MWKIGNIEINSPVVLAPMAGISNAAYIKICESMGVGYAITELISAEAIVRDNKKTFDMLKGMEEVNIPYAIQLFGSNPKTMANAAKIVNRLYPKAIIDINMGCPVPKVTLRSNAGSALLKNPELVGEIVREVVKSVDVPVTVKIRSGWDSEHINAKEIAKICEENGAKAISVHARTRAQGYSGTSDWNIIKEVVNAVNIPVIGNGDITTPELAKSMLDTTRCTGIMVGRGALGNPWLIKRINEYLMNGKILEEPDYKDKINLIKEHYNLLCKYKIEKVALLEIRTQAMWYLKGMPNSGETKNKICSSKTSKELFDVLDNYNTCL